MQKENDKDKILLPHHEQQSLCTTRLPYRQGRKFTAVKVYTITKESNHLLIFGVPSLNLRQEIKSQFMKFGKLLQFHISREHAAEKFTETYHAQYDRIQSARLAKRMLDTKNFYGGSLHVCYAPELETVDETYQKLVQRQRDVIFRLKNLQKNENTDISTSTEQHIDKTTETVCKKLNMGRINIISIGDGVKEVKRKKRKENNKKHRPCIVEDKRKKVNNEDDNITGSDSTVLNSTISRSAVRYNEFQVDKNKRDMSCDTEVELVDCTGVDSEVITNINEHLNYNNFGSEVIKKVSEKPLNRIQFHINKKS